MRRICFFSCSASNKYRRNSLFGDIMDDDEEEYYPELRIPHDMPSYKTKYRHSDDDMELDEEMDLPVMLPGTKEKERTKEKDAPTKPGTTPKRRGNPFKNPNPGVKEDPRGEKKNKEKMKQDFIGLINRAF